MKLDVALQGISRILLDTAPVIYHLESDSRRMSVMAAFFRERAAHAITLVTTPIALSECLVHPIQRGLADLEAIYRRLLLEGEGTEFRMIGADEAREAARLRADHGLNLADAFQAALALAGGCQAILTNDSEFKRVNRLRTLVVDEIEL
ncbi:type II toxin-antitoxin system VapC family toxin [Candidatus Sumerlaeota bacterium]|nr:type II toxin-antitoxin system VapC family toxin [Candidatus Sumerlaeota bacterium]MBI3736572.1 type II toxin-antitoxin system VapC family toxin [Candidatus Sumerlaeota bacterium]